MSKFTDSEAFHRIKATTYISLHKWHIWKEGSCNHYFKPLEYLNKCCVHHYLYKRRVKKNSRRKSIIMIPSDCLEVTPYKII